MITPAVQPKIDDALRQGVDPEDLNEAMRSATEASGDLFAESLCDGMPDMLRRHRAVATLRKPTNASSLGRCSGLVLCHLRRR